MAIELATTFAGSHKELVVFIHKNRQLFFIAVCFFSLPSFLYGLDCFCLVNEVTVTGFKGSLQETIETAVIPFGVNQTNDSLSLSLWIVPLVIVISLVCALLSAFLCSACFFLRFLKVLLVLLFFFLSLCDSPLENSVSVADPNHFQTRT